MPTLKSHCYEVNPNLRPVPAPGGNLLIYGCKSDEPLIISLQAYKAVISLASGMQTHEDNALIARSLNIENDSEKILNHLKNIEFLVQQQNSKSGTENKNISDIKELGLYKVLDLGRLAAVRKKLQKINLVEIQNLVNPFLLVILAFLLYNYYFGFLTPERKALSNNFLGQASILQIFLCFTISSFFTMLFKSFLSEFSSISYPVLYLKFLAGFHPIFDLGPDPSFKRDQQISKSEFITIISGNYIMRIYILIACLITLALWGPLNTNLSNLAAQIIAVLINISLVSLTWQLIPSPGSVSFKILEINKVVPEKFLGQSLRNTLTRLQKNQTKTFEQKISDLLEPKNRKYTLMLLYTVAISIAKLLFITIYVIPGFANDIPSLFGRWTSSIIYIILFMLSARYVLGNFGIGITKKKSKYLNNPINHGENFTNSANANSKSLLTTDTLERDIKPEGNRSNSLKRSHYSFKLDKILRNLTWQKLLAYVVVLSLIPFPISFTGSAKVLESSALSIKNSETLPVIVSEVYADGPSKNIIKKGTQIALLDSPALTSQIQETRQSILKLKADNSALQVQERSLLSGSKQSASVDYTNKLNSSLAEYEKNLEYIKSYSSQLPLYQSQANAYKELSKTGGVSYVQYQDKLIALEGIRLNLEAAKKSAKTAFEDLQIAKREKTRNQDLLLKEDIDTIKYNIKSNEREIRKNEYSLGDLERRLRDLVIVMPFDGVIDSDTTGLKGKKLSANETIFTVKKSPLTIIQVTLSEYDRTFIEVGDPCYLKLESRWRQSFTGKVSSISPTTTVDGGNQTVLVNIDLNHPLDAKYIGATGYGKIQNGYTNLAWNTFRPILRFLSVDIWSILP